MGQTRKMVQVLHPSTENHDVKASRSVAEQRNTRLSARQCFGNLEKQSSLPLARGHEETGREREARCTADAKKKVDRAVDARSRSQGASAVH